VFSLHADYGFERELYVERDSDVHVKWSKE